MCQNQPCWVPQGWCCGLPNSWYHESCRNPIAFSFTWSFGHLGQSLAGQGMGATPAICHMHCAWPDLGIRAHCRHLGAPHLPQKPRRSQSAFALSDLQQIVVGWKKQQVLTAMFACMAAFLLIALGHYIAYYMALQSQQPLWHFTSPRHCIPLCCFPLFLPSICMALRCALLVLFPHSWRYESLRQQLKTTWLPCFS